MFLYRFVRKFVDVKKEKFQNHKIELFTFEDDGKVSSLCHSNMELWYSDIKKIVSEHCPWCSRPCYLSSLALSWWTVGFQVACNSYRTGRDQIGAACEFCRFRQQKRGNLRVVTNMRGRAFCFLTPQKILFSAVLFIADIGQSPDIFGLSHLLAQYM